MNEAFLARRFKLDLEYRHVYINVQRSGLHKLACRYPAFPCAHIVNQILSHTDSKTMTINSASRQRLAYFLALDYHLMYHLLEPKTLMDSYFYATKNYLSIKDIFKRYVQESKKENHSISQTYCLDS